MAHLNPLSKILDTNRLTGPNYLDWLRNLKIVLNSKKITYTLDGPLPKAPVEAATQQEKYAYQKRMDDNLKARCYMMASISPELQKQHEPMSSAPDIFLHLQELYGEQSRTAKYNIVKDPFKARMNEGSSVTDHTLKMINHIEQLKKLDVIIEADMCLDIILQSLPDSFGPFILNFHMNKLEPTLPGLHNLLKMTEETLKKGKGSLLAFDGASTSKAKPKPKGKGKGKGKSTQGKKKKNLKPKGGIKKGNTDKAKGTCFHYGKDGHWKRNCREYLDTLKNRPSEGMDHALN